jgi:hypothetical protein
LIKRRRAYSSIGGRAGTIEITRIKGAPVGKKLTCRARDLKQLRKG